MEKMEMQMGESRSSSQAQNISQPHHALKALPLNARVLYKDSSLRSKDSSVHRSSVAADSNAVLM